ncbi:MAG: uridine phosphorylase [Thermodesulfobacteriota bacterium]
MGRVYHLDLTKAMLRGAKVALLPGDPFRSEPIAAEISRAYGGRSERLAWKREYCTYLVGVGGRSGNVLVTSTGIGGPSTSIAIDELARLGVRTFIRVGTTGAIQSRIKTGDVVITTGSVRLDGASTHYAPIEYPAVASHDVTSALVRGAEDAGVKSHLGVTASSDTFYPGEERGDSFRKYTIKRFQGHTRELRKLHVLNYEMESSTVLVLTASMGLGGGCITGVVNRGGTGNVTKKSLKTGEESVIRAAVAALAHLK